MAGAEGPEVSAIGCTAATPGDRVIDFAAARGRAATRKAARLIASGDVLAKALWDGVCLPAVVEEFAGGRVRDDAPEGRVSEEFASDFGGECPSADELRRTIAQGKECGQIDCQVDVGSRPREWGPGLILRVRVSGWILRVAVEEQRGEGQRALFASAQFRLPFRGSVAHGSSCSRYRLRSCARASAGKVVDH
jgi:hypothetical protein